LLGRFYFNARSPSGLQKAVAYFSMAIAQDSAFARAYAGLAETYSVILTYIEAPPDAVRHQAEAAADRALALDDRLAEAHTALAVVHANTFDWTGAKREYERAILLDPNDATAHLWHSQLLQTLGREQEQLQEVHRAAALDPLSVVINFSVASACYTWRRYDDAERQVQRTLALDSTFPFTHVGLGMLLTERYRYDEAIAEIQRGLALEGPQPITVHVAILARTEALAGRRADAEQLLAGLQARSTRGVVSPTAFAIVYASLGRTDDAFVWLAQAAQEHDPQLMLFFPAPPIFDAIRSDPRYERIKVLSSLQPQL
jgi:tetratricopeptide (TPR) repeat protein